MLASRKHVVGTQTTPRLYGVPNDALDELLRHSVDLKSLPEEVLHEIAAPQARWSDETDIHAEP